MLRVGSAGMPDENMHDDSHRLLLPHDQERRRNSRIARGRDRGMRQVRRIYRAKWPSQMLVRHVVAATSDTVTTPPSPDIEEPDAFCEYGADPLSDEVTKALAHGMNWTSDRSKNNGAKVIPPRISNPVENVLEATWCTTDEGYEAVVYGRDYR